jgi:hypothetical protein
LNQFPRAEILPLGVMDGGIKCVLEKRREYVVRNAAVEEN